MTSGQFIAIEGGDGAGKSMLARKMRSFGMTNVVVVQRRHFVARSEFEVSVLSLLRQTLWGGYEGLGFPSEFWMHLQIAWHIAIYSSTIRPLLNSGVNVLVDGWIWKFVAKMMIQGYKLDDLLVVLEAVRWPDHVVLVLQDAKKRASHRDYWSATERGLHAGFDVDNQDAFAIYQRKIDDTLLVLSERFGWSTLRSSESEDVAHLADRLAAHLQTRLNCGNGSTCHSKR